jgi:hypothetical protein
MVAALSVAVQFARKELMVGSSSAPMEGAAAKVEAPEGPAAVWLSAPAPEFAKAVTRA